jgi:hypothetical protein
MVGTTVILLVAHLVATAGVGSEDGADAFENIATLLDTAIVDVIIHNN